jgi:putative addiction module killer protein
MSPSGMDILEYQTSAGVSPFSTWFEALDAVVAAKVTVLLTRLSLGNTSSVKSIGDGLPELKLDFGPGYRVYFARDGSQLVILLGGGSKKKQQRDIDLAKASWGQGMLERLQDSQES